MPNVDPHGARTDLLRHARHAHDPPVPVEAHRADPIGPVVAHDVHLQLVEKRAAREAPRDERALPHALAVPAERHHHARVVVPHARQAPPHVQPHGKGTGPQAERPHHGLLGTSPEVRGREERCQPVGALPALAGDHGLLVQKKRTPLPAHPHRRHDRAPMHLVHPAKAVGVAVVVEMADRPHPAVPLPNVRLHVLQCPGRVPRRPPGTPSRTRAPSTPRRQARLSPSALRSSSIRREEHRLPSQARLGCCQAGWRKTR